jgi:hypothetical protein
LLPASLTKGSIEFLIKKSFKMICKRQGHVKCGKFFTEEHFKANDDETNSSWGPQNLALAA